MTARKRMSYFVGVDPGKHGGLAHLTRTGVVLSTTPMPEFDADLLAWLVIARREAKAAGHACRAVLEQVHSSPQMGVVSAFTFGEQNGRVKMALRAAGINYALVTPGMWQKALGIAPHAGDKRVLKAFAAQLFPKERVTNSIADALLIAEYGRREAGGRVRRGEEQAPVPREEPNDHDDERHGPAGEAAEAGAVAGDGTGAGQSARRLLPRPE